ncbi:MULTISPECIES: hypothetical protein [Metallosphaera]|nr:MULTISPECIES: hypothetical protein [Metallosphaera]AKV74139.1 hypothetical protein MsedA_1113 [Metallosphaera sedula]AKV76379.1 hypothetical protein MsedB_1115 [Metallosphaera sedula]AKV78630.1 hypothetical protein MsedC_1113 [Metallosphaera sedula]AKV80875.1 hypothetical protein MsedD_1114 [Metallosphaera sedula]MCY0862966.1 hypothetical protein [Metallosphaera prunae]
MANSDYFRGVAIGLLISWVTGLIAYLRTKDTPGLRLAFLYVVVLEIVLFAVFIVVSFMIRT